MFKQPIVTINDVHSAIKGLGISEYSVKVKEDVVPIEICVEVSHEHVQNLYNHFREYCSGGMQWKVIGGGISGSRVELEPRVNVVSELKSVLSKPLKVDSIHLHCVGNDAPDVQTQGMHFGLPNIYMGENKGLESVWKRCISLHLADKFSYGFENNGCVGLVVGAHSVNPNPVNGCHPDIPIEDIIKLNECYKATNGLTMREMDVFYQSGINCFKGMEQYGMYTRVSDKSYPSLALWGNKVTVTLEENKPPHVMTLDELMFLRLVGHVVKLSIKVNEGRQYRDFHHGLAILKDAAESVYRDCVALGWVSPRCDAKVVTRNMSVEYNSVMGNLKDVVLGKSIGLELRVGDRLLDIQDVSALEGVITNLDSMFDM
ncbi:hypothetical protein GR7B_00163 [Vibrio phage vB_VcorM_GR7B]|nr:hypothetical protein GR7B_00163 [Vibrio phage vB_VcorM_GR7B]